MRYYAILNSENTCIGLSRLAGEVNSDHHVRVFEYDKDLLFRKYENDKWSSEKFLPENSEETD